MDRSVFALVHASFLVMRKCDPRHGSRLGGWGRLRLVSQAMIVGIGIDVLQNRRVERELARGEWEAGDGVFSADEIRACNSTGRPARRFAACFAAKEATLKALGLGLDDLAVFREVEVSLDTAGIALRNRLQQRSEQLGVRRIRLSTAVSRDLTGAMVILES